MLVDGHRSKDWCPTDDDGNRTLTRKPSTFRNWITPAGRSKGIGETVIIERIKDGLLLDDDNRPDRHRPVRSRA